MTFQRTYQTAGYVRPYPLMTDASLITNSCRTWQLLDKLARTRSDANENYDQFKTHLHSLMHNRPHQAEV